MLCLRSARLSCALLALSIAPGFATVVQFNDITAWQNATAAGFTTITFEGIVPQQFTTGFTIGDGTTFGGVNHPVWVDNLPEFGSGKVLRGPTCCSSGGILITLPSSNSFTSVGFNIMTYDVGGISFIATLNNLSTQYTSPTLAWPTVAFFGFTTTADTPITNILLSLLPPSASGDYPLIDNFRYGTTAAAPPADTPEVCTLLLIGLGLTGMSVFRRRLRRVAAAA
jgi:hypothetical protein